MQKDFPYIYKDSTEFSLESSYLKSINNMNNDNDVLSQIMKLDIKNTLNDNYLQKNRFI